MKIELRYPKGIFQGDCLRGLSGFALITVLFSLGPPGPLVSLILAALAGLFLVFIHNAWQRAHSGYFLDEDTLEDNGQGSFIRWSELSDMTLVYYSTRSDQRGGWWELKLVAGSRVIKVDSRLNDFSALVQRAAQAARARHLILSPATHSNARAVHTRLGNGAPSGMMTG